VRAHPFPATFPAPVPPGAELAFYLVFGAFVVAMVVLAVVTITWAVRRDREGRAAWVRRHRPGVVPDDRTVHPPMTNGHGPRDHSGTTAEDPE
jgi:hypothetical protein